MKLGLIGCGALGIFLLEKINKEKRLQYVEIISIFDEREKSKTTLGELEESYNVKAFQDADEFLQSGIDVVVECANIEAVQQYAPRMLAKKDLLVISIGAFVDADFYNELKRIAAENKRKLILPSGAIGGLDLIRAAKLSGGLQEVTITTRKPASTLIEAKTAEATVIFDGLAKDAIQKFPKNVNVAIILSLAGLGPNKTKVKVIADPSIDKNNHTIYARGDFGECTVTIENFPMPTNPKTSYLTALSILASIKTFADPVIIG